MDNTDRMDSSRVALLDLLRLAAVAAVVLYHYAFWGPTSTNGVSQVALPSTDFSGLSVVR
jgi:peptidoglycan/LPS O-acetylase OafA/YrhL